MGQTDQITDMSGLFRVAIEIAGKRRETLQRLRTALLNSETKEVYKYAREICGLENGEAKSTGELPGAHTNDVESELRMQES